MADKLGSQRRYNMKIKIKVVPAWLWEKGQRFEHSNSNNMWRAFQSLRGLVLPEAMLTEVAGQPALFGATVKALKDALLKADHKTALFEWNIHWNRLGLSTRDVIGIPVDCCHVIENKQ